MAQEQITFESADIRIGGTLVVPDSRMADIGVICVTGGAKPADELYNQWQWALEERGISSLAFDARGKGSSEGEWSSYDQDPVSGIHYNSQASRTADTVEAVSFFRGSPDVPSRVVLLGASMGGDIVIHAAERLKEKPDGLLLKAPAAYDPNAHQLAYGKHLKQQLTSKHNYPAMSENFRILHRLGLPTQLFFANGEEIISPEIAFLYKLTVEGIGGEVVEFGDETTKHGYFFAKDELSQRATEETIEKSAEFILGLLNR